MDQIKPQRSVSAGLNYENRSDSRVDYIPKKNRYSSGSLAYQMEKTRTPKTSRGNDFAYVNPAFAGSENSVHTTRVVVPVAPPTHVVREQYWACSRWPAGQRLLAIAVGILIGTVIGLGVAVAMLKGDDESLTTFFRRSHSTPD